jgi:hypothetical protein
MRRSILSGCDFPKTVASLDEMPFPESNSAHQILFRAFDLSSPLEHWIEPLSAHDVARTKSPRLKVLGTVTISQLQEFMYWD